MFGAQLIFEGKTRFTDNKVTQRTDVNRWQLIDFDPGKATVIIHCYTKLPFDLYSWSKTLVWGLGSR